MCSMLHDQQKKHGMAYAIVVWNGPDDVFVRVRSDTTQQAIEMELAVDLVKDSLVDSTKDNPVVHLERSKIRNEG